MINYSDFLLRSIREDGLHHGENMVTPFAMGPSPRNAAKTLGRGADRLSSVELEQRLRRGKRLIEVEQDPERRAELEDFWLQLLAAYKEAVDQERRQEEQSA